MNPCIKKLLHVARGEIGTREVGSSNTGKRVEEYQAATTLGGSGWPWCSAYCSWCMEKALGKVLSGRVWCNSASCDEVLDWARRRGIISTTPTPGCMGLVMASKNNATHIFIVSEVLESGFRTIEGNSNNNGSREGNGVYAHFRRFAPRYLFVRWEKLIPHDSAHVIGGVAAATYGLYFADDNATDLKRADLEMFDGQTWCPAWKWAHWFGYILGWNPEAQTVVLTGREVPHQVRLVGGRAWLPIEALAAFSGLKATVDAAARKVTVSRKAAQR